MARFIFNTKRKNKDLNYLKFLRSEVYKARGKAEGELKLEDNQTLEEAYSEDIARLVCHQYWYLFDYMLLDYSNYDLQLLYATNTLAREILSKIPDYGLEIIGD